MKNILKISLLYFTLQTLFISCEMKSNGLSKNNNDELTIEVHRYDRLQCRYLTTGDFSALQQMSISYPIETRTLIEDVLCIGQVDDAEINSKLLKYFQDSITQNIILDTEVKYADMTDINQELTLAFKKLKTMFTNIKIPSIYAQISALNHSVVVNNGVIGISLDKYLGSNYPIYKKYYTPYQRSTMNRENIVPDCIVFYLLNKYPPKTFENQSSNDLNMHLAKMQWIVNEALGRSFFKGEGVTRVAEFMKDNKKINAEQLLTENKISCCNVM